MLEPSAASPNGAALLTEIRTFLRRFMVLPSPAVSDLLALWVVHTHAIEAAWATPYIRVVSAAPGCGKTQLLELLAAITRGGWLAVNPSVAVLYRKIDRDRPTLLLDEIDNYQMDDRKEALAVLNTGYKRGARVDRCKDTGELQSFECFGPKAYAGLDAGAISDTLLSRSVTIRLERRLPTESIERCIEPHFKPDADALRARCATWAEINVGDLREIEPELPAWLYNRSAEVWWSLLAIAELVGGEWPDRALNAARELSAGGDAVDELPPQTRLLLDIRTAFDETDRLATGALLEYLNALDESPWGARRRGEGLDARALAKMLRPFKTSDGLPLKPKVLRIEGRTPRGYALEQFEDAFARYLPEAQQAQPAQQVALALERDVADVADVADFEGDGWLSDNAKAKNTPEREKSFF